MSIEVNDESTFTPALDLTEISALATYVLDQMRVHPGADLNVLLTDEAVISRLHVEWMGIEGATDVLSFPMDELRPAPLGVEPQEGILGDIVVCPQVAATQAFKAGHSTVDEVLLLVTHGILHLLGYDHVEEAERAEMFDLQRTLLLTFLATRGGSTNDITPTVE